MQIIKEMDFSKKILYCYFALIVIISMTLRDKYRKTTVCGFKFGIKKSFHQPARCVQVWHFNHLTYTTWLNESSLCKNKFNIFCIHFLQKEDSIVNILLLLSFIGKKGLKNALRQKKNCHIKSTFSKKYLFAWKKAWNSWSIKWLLPFSELTKYGTNFAVNGVMRFLMH